MRLISVQSHCNKQARKSTQAILDGYLWRSSDNCWSGHISDACLNRVSQELKSQSDRGMCIEAYEETSEGRSPLFSVKGKKSAFTPDIYDGRNVKTLRSIVGISVFFHDFGKAACAFQDKINRAIAGDGLLENQGDPVRHEVFSTYVCDSLFGNVQDRHIAKHIASLSIADFDAAAEQAAKRCADLYNRHLGSGSRNVSLELEYVISRQNSVARAICDLVLTHHRLPTCLDRFNGYGSRNHVNVIDDLEVTEETFLVSDGVPFWHEELHLERLRKHAGLIDPKSHFSEILHHQARMALMFADHLGSADKSATSLRPDHIANTVKVSGDVTSADSLSTHVEKVSQRCRSTVFAVCNDTHHLPSLTQNTAPLDIVQPPHTVPEVFSWQKNAADAAAQISSKSEGGFFACLLAGTGTGKTRGAPTVLASATFQDANPKRRSLRFVLGLGLRNLASQSSKEYIDELGFSEADVSTMIGVPPIEFDQDEDQDDAALTDWFDIEPGERGSKKRGDREELEWLRALSHDVPETTHPIFTDIVEKSGRDTTKLRKLIEAPILCATVDHIASIASPVRSRHLGPALRMLTSDLILDEIDQYGPEDITALTRLVYYVGLSGRRCIIMSATLPQDIASAMFSAYKAGWKAYAKFYGAAPFVNALVASDLPGTIYARTKVSKIEPMFSACTKKMCKELELVTPKRRVILLPEVDTWADIVDQAHETCNNMHEQHAVEIDGLRISVGLVKLTRISHTVAMAAQLPFGVLRGVLRKKVCLHSKFPRISRAWIEDQMKGALRRKGRDPNAGLRQLCEKQNIFEEARDAGVTEVQIVFITSPVIETGNDIDFDYAILDPLDMRSLIQAAGRVLRHRSSVPNGPNIALFSKSIVAMETGRVALPGVETSLAKITRVNPIRFDRMDALRDLEDPRRVSALMGRHGLNAVDARLVLQADLDTPWRAADQELRRRFLFGLYSVDALVKHPCVRFSTILPITRKFRRSDSEDAELTLTGLEPALWAWQIDLNPSHWPHDRRISPRLRRGPDCEGFLFQNVFETALLQKCGSLRVSQADLLRYSSVVIRNPVTENSDVIDLPVMTIFDQFGVLKGEDTIIFEGFGKS